MLTLSGAKVPKYLHRRLRPRRFKSPPYALSYPANFGMTAEMASEVKRAWLQASRARMPIVIPDNMKIQRLR